MVAWWLAHTHSTGERSSSKPPTDTCLQDRASGQRGDTRFTLESLPTVIAEATETGRLVVFRHVGGG